MIVRLGSDVLEWEVEVKGSTSGDEMRKAEWVRAE